ncbi:hypothetical protein R1X32_49210 [Rhodococcus opacus]|uniref:hypothetical protein n=1 Tax=Rhodococcus opacus TaxID=37919 RepID=UPI0034D19087
MCLLGGKKVAALMPNPDENATSSGGTSTWRPTISMRRSLGPRRQVALLMEPMDIAGQGRMAMVRDPSGAQFGLWQGRAHVGCELVNEPNALLRNDLVTPNPGPAREFYTAVFDFTLDGNDDFCPAWTSPAPAQTGRARDRWRRGRPVRLGVLLGHALPGRRHRCGRRRRAGRRGRADDPTDMRMGGPRMSPIRSVRSSRWVPRCRCTGVDAPVGLPAHSWCVPGGAEVIAGRQPGCSDEAAALLDGGPISPVVR